MTDPIKELINKIYDDIESNAPSREEKRDLIFLLGSLEVNIQNLQSRKNEISGQKGSEMDEKQRLAHMVQKLKTKDRLTYLDELIALLGKSPYTLPQTYFEPETGNIVEVETPRGQPSAFEPIDTVMRLLFPGSTSRRYDETIKINCGSFSNANTCDLSIRHTLTSEPIFSIKNRDVYGLTRLTSRSPRRDNQNRYWICSQCLTVSDGDELCQHSPNLRRPRTQFSNSPIIETVELSDRTIKETKSLQFPLNQIIGEISFLNNLEIGVVLTGFNRTALESATRIRYNPFIGFKMNTKGILFKINEIPDGFYNEILKSDYLVRDIIIGMLHEPLIESMILHGRTIFEAELFTSGCIKSLGLDRIGNEFDYHSVVDQLHDENWIENTIIQIRSEAGLYEGERHGLTDDVIINILGALREISLDAKSIRIRIRKLILNSLAQMVYITSCFTSGSLYEELDYMIPEDKEGQLKNEILIFDSTNGANGASELIFDYLTVPTEERKIEFGKKEDLYRPRYFDEAFSEILLPCTQGVAERMFFQNIHEYFNDKSIRAKINHLEKIREESDSIVKMLLEQVGIRNMFPYGTGLREIDDEDEDLTNNESYRIKEISSICIHGCPDCLMLADKSKTGQYSERYSVSKCLIDNLYKYGTRSVLLPSSATQEDIKKKLEIHGLVIITKKIGKDDTDYSDIEDKLSDLIGKNINDKFIKLAGKWVDCPLSKEHYVEVSYVLSLL